MINFAVKEVRKDSQLDRVRRITMGVTTAILTAYVVAVAAMIGWKMYLEDKEETQLGEINGLTEQIIAKSTSEVLIRKIALRSKTTKDFLNSREDVSLSASNLVDSKVIVAKWTYKDINNQQVQLNAASPVILGDFVDQLSNKYAAVQINQSQLSDKLGWVSIIKVGGVSK